MHGQRLLSFFLVTCYKVYGSLLRQSVKCTSNASFTRTNPPIFVGGASPKSLKLRHRLPCNTTVPASAIRLNNPP
jgi:hypothetical protein